METIFFAIVDDDKENIRSLVESLSDFPAVSLLFTAGNGQEFLQKLPQYPQLQAVLMDVDMPQMNGIEAVRKCKLEKTNENVAIIMLTVFDDEDKIFEAIQAGAVGYLVKEEKPQQIVTAIEEAITLGGSPMSPRIARKALQLLSQAPQNNAHAIPAELTKREIEILKEMVNGLDYREIASLLYISPHTVRSHIDNIYKKLHVKSKVEVVQKANKNRWF